MSNELNPSAFRNRTLFPVILPVPNEVRELPPRDRVIFLSRHARQALKMAADKSGVRVGEVVKDENGVPQPYGGLHWSISHKTQYVCGVVAPMPIGIDIEKIRDISEGVYQKTASEQEWALADKENDSILAFFRYWTAKEAVLKATGIGIKDLLKCQVQEIVDKRHLRIHYAGQDWLIEHFLFDRHLTSIVQHQYRLEWSVEQST